MTEAEDKTGFTAGPWRVGKPHPQNACAYVYSSDGTEIATLYGGDKAKQDENGVWGPQPQRDASANLIAAATDLYEALKEARTAAVELASLMREGAHDKEEIHWCKVVDKIDAALARARGEAMSASETREGTPKMKYQIKSH